MRVSGFWTLMGAIVTGLIIADLWAHQAVTNSVIKASTTTASLIAGK
jgi:hypothetical protein